MALKSCWHFPLCLIVGKLVHGIEERQCAEADGECQAYNTSLLAAMPAQRLLQLSGGVGGGVMSGAQLLERAQSQLQLPAGLDMKEMLVLIGEGTEAPKGVIKQFNLTLENNTVKNILDGHKDDQAIMDNLTDTLKTCSAVFQMGVNAAAALKITSDSAKRAHLSCRKTQATKVAANRSAWTNLANFVSKLKMPMSSIPTSPDASMDMFFNQTKTWVVGSHATYFALKPAYMSANNGLRKQQDVCDAKQSSFESGHCSWLIEATNTKSAYEACWGMNSKIFQSTKATLLDSESHRKAEFDSIRKIQCMLQAMYDKPKGLKKNATKQLKACHSLVVDTSLLNLTNTTAPGQDDMSSLGNLSLKPGDASWRTLEYVEEFKANPSMISMLRSITACNLPQVKKVSPKKPKTNLPSKVSGQGTLTGGSTSMARRQFTLYKLPATTGFTNNLAGTKKYLALCLAENLLPVGCGTSVFDCDARRHENQLCVPMPKTWGCNMLNSLSRFTGWTDLVTLLADRRAHHFLYRRKGRLNSYPQKSDKLSPVCAKVHAPSRKSSKLPTKVSGVLRTGGAAGIYEGKKFELYKLPATTGFSARSSESTKKYMALCLAEGLLPVGCGTHSYDCNARRHGSQACVPMPKKWGCNMAWPLSRFTSWTNFVVLLADNTHQLYSKVSTGVRRPRKTDNLHPICGKILS